ncbi:MAG: hypothetical protein HGB17_15925 [Syntrophobacteraceae bacterium]|nr:hypothetical protein [Syntrophobacteraceae bacterium]
MRISFALTHERSVREINRKQEDLDRLGSIVSSGKKLLDPSDDPAGWAKAMNLKQGLQEMETFEKNMQFGLSWGKMTVVTLDHLSTLIMDARKIASGALIEETSEERAANIQILEQTVKDALEMANSENGNRYLFSGLADPTPNPPFTLDDDPASSNYGQVTYHGDTGRIQVRTGRDSNGNSPISLNGDEVMNFTQNGSTLNVIHELWALREAFKGNDTAGIRSGMANLDGALENVRSRRAVLDSRLLNLETRQQALGALKINSKAQLSELEDANMAEAIAGLQQKQTAFEASLRVTAMVDDLNLMKFL